MAVQDSSPPAQQSQDQEVSPESSSNLSNKPRLSRPRGIGLSPDTVGSQLNEGSSQRPAVDSIFSEGIFAKALKEANERRKERFGFDSGFNYTLIYQRADRALPGRLKDSMVADLEIYGSWKPFHRRNNSNGHLVFNFDNRSRLTSIPNSQLGNEIGSGWGVTTGFDVQNLTVSQLYWEQGEPDDPWILRFGRLDPTLMYDSGQCVSDYYAFLSPSFSDTLTMAFPQSGFGVTAGLFPLEDWYVYLGIQDGNGSLNRAGWDTFFGDGEFFSAIEIGYTPNFGEADEANYHVTLWHRDALTNSGVASDAGVALSFEKQFGRDGNWVPFCRLGMANRGVLNGVDRSAAIGLGRYNVLGKNEDLFGLALGWGRTTMGAKLDQSVFESFYRIVLTPNSHITPDLQVIINPANNPNRDPIAVFGVRFRTLY